jgi:porin
VTLAPLLVAVNALAEGGASDSPAAPVLRWEWFPAREPALAPYLASVNQYGAECLQAGALVPADPVSDAAQWVKTELARHGITYRLDNSCTFAAMSNVARGQNTLSYCNMQLLANWVLFDTPDLGGTAGWLVFQANAGVGLGFELREQSPQQNIGTVTWPNYGWVTSSAYISQVGWAQSFLGGELVVSAGMLDPTIPLDANTYANNQYGQLMNWAFVNSQVLPYAFGSLGAIVQWQPAPWFYAMVATGANNTPSGRPPWYALSGANWTTLGELGFVSEDTFGLGKGVARLQPFVATVQGDVGGGVALNVEQRLGRDQPLALFGRMGVGSPETARVNGARAQVAGGVALMGSGSAAVDKDAVDYLAMGFAWTRVDAPAVHENECVLELTAVRNLTPTLAIQPDVQVIWDPAYGPADVNVVFQLQLVFIW